MSAQTFTWYVVVSNECSKWVLYGIWKILKKLANLLKPIDKFWTELINFEHRFCRFSSRLIVWDFSFKYSNVFKFFFSPKESWFGSKFADCDWGSRKCGGLHSCLHVLHRWNLIKENVFQRKIGFATIHEPFSWSCLVLYSGHTHSHLFCCFCHKLPQSIWSQGREWQGDVRRVQLFQQHVVCIGMHATTRWW